MDSLLHCIYLDLHFYLMMHTIWDKSNLGFFHLIRIDYVATLKILPAIPSNGFFQEETKSFQSFILMSLIKITDCCNTDQPIKNFPK